MCAVNSPPSARNPITSTAPAVVLKTVGSSQSDALNGCKTFLELHFGSESDYYGAVRPSAYIRVVLQHWLQEEHGRDIRENIELEAVLGIPGSHTVRPEVRAKTVSYVAQRAAKRFSNPRISAGREDGQRGPH